MAKKVRKNNEWGQLSMRDKAALIDIYVKNGVTDIDSIRNDYERNREHFLKSDANFVQRLRNNDTMSVDLGGGNRGTHLMSYAEGDNDATIFPLLQESNGTLENHIGDENAWSSAVEKGDTVNVSKPFAEWYATNYKPDFSKFFEKFNKNAFEDGGDKKDKKYVRPKGSSLKEDMAYRIGAEAYAEGYGNAGTVIRGLSNKKPEFIPELYAYIYGPDGIYNEVSGKSNGFDYSNYLKKAGYNNVKEYGVTINPLNGYSVDDRYAGLIREMAKKGSRIYDNANSVLNPDAYDLENFDERPFDAGNFIHKFNFDDNGNIVISDSDVYDFYPKDYHYGKPVTAYIQSSMMNGVGHPYVVRQDNQPIEIYNEKIGSNTMYPDLTEKLESLSDEEIANILGNGYIEPSVIAADEPKKYDEGGDTKKSRVGAFIDNVWNNAKNMVSGFIYKPNKDIDWSDIVTTKGRTYNPRNIEYINEKLDTIPPKRRAAIIGDIIEESGGNPHVGSGTKRYKGLLQWGPDRMIDELPKDEKEAIDASLQHMVETMTNPNDGKSWTHGGTGSGYNSRMEPYGIFYDDNASLEDVHRAFSFGYVRPLGKQKSYENRQKVVEQVYKKLTENK